MPTPPSTIHRLATTALVAALCVGCSGSREATMLVLDDGTRLHGDVQEERPGDVVFVAHRISVPSAKAVRPAASLDSEARRHSPHFVDLYVLGSWLRDVTIRDRTSTTDAIVYDVEPKDIQVQRSDVRTIDTAEIPTYFPTEYSVLLGLGGVIVVTSVVVLAMGPPSGSGLNFRLR